MTEFTTTVGRVVWGHPMIHQFKEDQNTKQPIMKNGEKVKQWVFGVAYPKADFEQYIMPWLQQEAIGAFPQTIPTNFSWKFKDGDTAVAGNGTPYRDMDGRAGCYILTISTEAFQPPVYHLENGAYRQIEANEMKTGDFVAIGINVKFNGATGTHTPGLYINPVGVELVAYGAEIVGVSANPDELFGGQARQLPPGASATPLAPTNAGAAPHMGQPAVQQPMGQPMAQPVQQQPMAQPVQQQPMAQPMAAPLDPLAQNGAVLASPAAGLPVGVNPQQPMAQPLPPPATDFVQNATGQQPVAPVMPGAPLGR